MSHQSDDDRHFREWRRQVSALIEARFGLSLDDLPDMMTRSAFDDGTSPEEFFGDTVMDVMREEFGEAVDALWPT